MKRDLYYSKIERCFLYRRIKYMITIHNNDCPSIERAVIANRTSPGLYNEKGFFCAYVFIDTKKYSLGIDLENPMIIREYHSVDFLNSKIINEIGEYARGGFTYAKWSCSTENLNLVGKIELGWDYDHAGDEEAGHTLESVCEDCEKLIDKIHDMGIFKGNEDGK